MTIQDIKNIRESYKSWEPRSDPYAFYNWDSIFSPIERLVWIEIRNLGLNFYPQFPVLSYFVDFADPIKKIAIELDGKEYHQDLQKDMRRQNEIENDGWTIYRITGSKVMQDVHDEYEEDFDSLYASEMMLRDIKYTHYNDFEPLN